VTEAAGIRFTHDNGAYGKKLFPEIMGSGCAFFDANGDGLLDIFLVNGSPMPGHPHPAPQPSRLYINRGDGTFEDRTKGSGLEAPGYGMGVAVADVDNDGDEDLYITRLGKCSLYLNRGDGVFKEVADAAGARAEGFCSSAAFLDYDGDGLPDLYVCRDVKWDSPRDDYRCLNPAGQKQYCDVHVYDGVEHRLFHNLGGGRFEDVTRASGVGGHVGRGLAVVCGDYDADGDTDIFVANDETPDFLWQNQGHGKFLEVAGAAGFAYNEKGQATSGMGLDLADADGDGSPDVIESNFQGSRKTLYVNDGHGMFTAEAGGKGLGDMTLSRLAFGIGFLDYDLDGWPDVFLANGHVIDDIQRFSPEIPFKQTAQLFRNAGRAVFTDASAQLGAYSQRKLVGRGAAFGDYDNDGDTDILVMHNAGPAVLLRNENPHRHHWLGIRCVGSHGNRDGIGVRVTLAAGGRVQVDETRAASSYLSSSDPRLLFGLGDATRVERLTVTWPGGASQEFASPPIDRYLTLTEGRPLR
jgi:hypothetical protein